MLTNHAKQFKFSYTLYRVLTKSGNTFFLESYYRSLKIDQVKEDLHT